MTTKHLLIAILLSVHYLTGMTEDKPVITLSADNITHLWDQSSLADYLTNEDALPLIHTSKDLAIFFTQQRKAVIKRFESKIAAQYTPKNASERAKENALVSYETIDINNIIFPRFFRPNAAPYCIGTVNEWHKSNDIYENRSCYLAKLTFLSDDTLKITKEDAPTWYASGVIDSGRYWRCDSTNIDDPNELYRNVALFNADCKCYVIKMPPAYKENFFDKKITYSRDDASFIISRTMSSGWSCDNRTYQSHDYYHIQMKSDRYSKICKTYTTDVWGQVKPFDKSRYLPKLLTFLINNAVKTEKSTEINEAGWAHADVLFNLPFDNPLWPAGIQSVFELYYSDQMDNLTAEQQIQIYAFDRWAGIRHNTYNGSLQIYIEKHPERRHMREIMESYPKPIRDCDKKVDGLLECINSSVDYKFSVPYTTARAMHWLENQAEDTYRHLPIRSKLWHFPNRYISEKIYSTLGAFLIRFMPSMESIRFG